MKLGTTQRVLDVNRFCNSCHNGTGASVTTPISTHSNSDFGNRSGSDFQLKCTSCHDSHDSSNLFIIRSDVLLSNGVTVGPINFAARTGANSFDDGKSPVNTRICVACHEAVAGMRHTGGAEHEGNFDFTGEDCSTCHPHSADSLAESRDGFMIVPNVRELLIARAQVDLQVSQMPSTHQLVAGEPFTYTLTVFNNGPQDAWGVVISDTLPASMEVLSITPPGGGNCTIAAVIRCELGDIQHDKSVALSLSVFPASDLYGLVPNRVEVSALQADPASGNNVSISNDVIIHHADLSVDQIATPPSVLAGEPLSYTLTIVNHGPSVARRLTVQDTLPDGVDFLSATASQGQCSEAQGIVTCDLGVLRIYGEATVVINVIAGTVNGTAANVATVTGDDYDPNTSNNVTNASSVIAWTVDLSLTQSAQSLAVETGRAVTYTLTARNAGPLDAANVVLTDSYPAGATLIRVTASQGTCADEGDQVTCRLGELAADAEAVVSLAIRAPEISGDIINEASIAADPMDSHPDNNTSALTVSVYDGPDLSVEIVTEPAIIAPDEELKYTIPITNNGPSPATGVILVDTMPEGTTLVTATSTKGPCYVNLDKISCEIGAMGVQQGETVTIVVAVPADGSATLVNAATVSVHEIDPDLQNNTAIAVTQVVAQADLTISTEGWSEISLLKQRVAYTITVSNLGPSPATHVTMTDILSPESLFDSVQASQGVCEEKEGEIICALGEMAKDARVVVVIYTEVQQETVSLVNTAFVVSDVSDPNDHNNTAMVIIPTLPLTPTPIITPTVTATITPTVTATITPTVTATITPTVSATITPTVTATITPTPLSTATPTPAVTPIPAFTGTPTPTPTPTPVPTPTPTPTIGPAPVSTPTQTPTPTSTPTPGVTPSPTATPTPLPTPTFMPIATSTPTPRGVFIDIPTPTATPTPAPAAANRNFHGALSPL